MVWPEGERSSIGPIVQGKPVVRRGRKARDLLRKTARPPITGERRLDSHKESIVKANLARFTGVMALLASLALTLGAGLRWY